MKKIFATLALSAVLATSCTAAQRTAGKDVAIDCAKVDLGTNLPQIGMTVGLYVMSLIFDGPAGWAAKLAQLATQVGPDVVSCAEKTAEALFRPAPAQAGVSTSEEPGIETPHDRAIQALTGKSFK